MLSRCLVNVLLQLQSNVLVIWLVLSNKLMFQQQISIGPIVIVLLERVLNKADEGR